MAHTIAKPSLPLSSPCGNHLVKVLLENMLAISDDRLNTFTKVIKEVTEVVDGIKVCHISESMHRLKLY